MIKSRGPSFAKALATGDGGPPSFNVDGIAKDMRTMLAEARSRGLAGLPVVEAALGVVDKLSAEGKGEYDMSIIPTYTPSQLKS